MRFGLVVLHDMLALAGYLMLNPVYHIYYKQIVCKLICLRTVKSIQVLLSNTNNSICTRSSGFEYCYLFVHRWFQALLFKTNSSICTQLNGFKCYYLLFIQLNDFKYSYVILIVQLNGLKYRK